LNDGGLSALLSLWLHDILVDKLQLILVHWVESFGLAPLLRIDPSDHIRLPRIVDDDIRHEERWRSDETAKIVFNPVAHVALEPGRQFVEPATVKLEVNIGNMTPDIILHCFVEHI
jgi:hypothetical protein